MALYIPAPQETSATTETYIAGGLIASVVGFAVLLYLLHFLRSRQSKTNTKRIEGWGPAFPRVRGVIRPEISSLSPSVPPLFSRCGLTASIVMPEKSITRKPSSHGLSDKTFVSSQSSPTSSISSHKRPPPCSSSPPFRPRATSILNPACLRHSRSSSGFSHYARHPSPSELNSRLSCASSVSPSQVRPVRQLFEPALPDELAPFRCGECLMVLQTFDDGWCLVARDTSRFSRSSRLSAWMASNGDNADIGLVPAWVFVKPLKGITFTRPFRSASINALHLGQKPAHTRDAVISWSNFA